ncbi:MAG: carboxypeptidase-like regulatory domain-containing protein [Vicingaceae bacterium]
MKSLTLIIAVLFSSVLVLTSCEEENITPGKIKTETSQKKQSRFQKDGGGEEEEWIIIYGVVQELSSPSRISNARVVLYDANQVNPLDTAFTNVEGEFQFENDSADYSFIVTASGYQTVESINYSFPNANPVTISMEH